MALPTKEAIQMLETSELIVMMLQLHMYSADLGPDIVEFDDATLEELQGLFEIVTSEVNRRCPMIGTRRPDAK